MVRHIVFWKIRDDENKQANLEQMRELLLGLTNSINGVVSNEIGFNFSSSDYDIILDAVFMDPFALKQYQSHPDNMRINNFLNPILLDRVVCDYMINSVDSPNKNLPPVNFSKTESMSQSSSRVQNSSSLQGDFNKPNSIPSNNGYTNNPVNNQAVNPSYGASSNMNNSAFSNSGNLNSSLRNQSSNMAPNLANTNPLNNVMGSLNKSLMNPKRDTLAMNPTNLNDDAFALPYERNYQNDDTSFNLPPYSGSNSQMNAGQSQMSSQQSTSNYGSSDMMYGNPSQSVQPSYNMDSNFALPNSQGRNDTMSRRPQNRSFDNTSAIPPVNPRMQGQGNYGYGSPIGNTGRLPNMGYTSEPQNQVEVPWKCPQCGKLNPAFANICGCGRRKSPMKRPTSQRPQNQRKPMPNLSLPGPGAPSDMNSVMFDNQSSSSMMNLDSNNSSDRAINAWVCPTCGKVNGDFVGMCACGQRKPARNDYNSTNTYQQPQQQAAPQRKAASRQKQSNLNGFFKNNSTNSSSNYNNGYDQMNTMNMNSSTDTYYNNDPNVYDMDDSQVITMQRNSSGRKSDNNWKCPRCGKIHGNFVGQCGCGQRKPSRNTMSY